MRTSSTPLLCRVVRQESGSAQVKVVETVLNAPPGPRWSTTASGANRRSTTRGTCTGRSARLPAAPTRAPRCFLSLLHQEMHRPSGGMNESLRAPTNRFSYPLRPHPLRRSSRCTPSFRSRTSSRTCTWSPPPLPTVALTRVPTVHSASWCPPPPLPTVALTPHGRARGRDTRRVSLDAIRPRQPARVGPRGQVQVLPPPPLPSRNNWTRLVPPPVLTGHGNFLVLQRSS